MDPSVCQKHSETSKVNSGKRQPKTQDKSKDRDQTDHSHPEHPHRRYHPEEPHQYSGNFRPPTPIPQDLNFNRSSINNLPRHPKFTNPQQPLHNSLTQNELPKSYSRLKKNSNTPITIQSQNITWPRKLVPRPSNKLNSELPEKMRQGSQNSLLNIKQTKSRQYSRKEDNKTRENNTSQEISTHLRRTYLETQVEAVKYHTAQINEEIPNQMEIPETQEDLEDQEDQEEIQEVLCHQISSITKGKTKANNHNIPTAPIMRHHRNSMVTQEITNDGKKTVDYTSLPNQANSRPTMR